MALNDLFQPLLDKLPAPLRNKFFLVLVLFAGWMIFFDKHDVITQWRLQRTVNNLEQDSLFYSKKIEEAEQTRLDLEVNREKYARERYYMKKNDEDVFVIVKEEEE